MFRHSLFWPDVASLSNPLMVTRAYAARLAALGGVVIKGDARSLHRADGSWRVDTDAGPIDAENAVVALGPWSPDVLEPLGIKVPLGIKRGYHRHFDREGQRLADAAGDRHRVRLCADARWSRASASPPARSSPSRDAPATPVQFDRLMPHAQELFPLGEPNEAEPWLGRRPNMPDSLPVLGRAPGQHGLWLAFGHGHWGLTLGPVTGQLIADMMTGTTPFTDPAPYRADRFARVTYSKSGSTPRNRELNADHLLCSRRQVSTSACVAFGLIARLFKPGARELVELVLVLRRSRHRRTGVLVVGYRHGGRLSMAAITNGSRGIAAIL